jgi:threonylcarbamoyladenosine tRNA methylthiotransferase MtaB
MLHKAKAMNPDAVVIATGCYVQTDTEGVLKDASVDIAIGNNEKARIIEILNEYLKKHEKTSSILDIMHTSEYETMTLTDTAERTRAYIKIQDGCNQFCTYCLIPFARGPVRSRDKDEILREIDSLSKKGYKEFVLTGIHVSSYGVTRPGHLEENRLAELLEAINALPDVERIRLSSLEPRVMTEDFVKRISALKKLCPHFHLSLQSGCDETLKRMNRHYTAAEFKEGVMRLRNAFSDPAITTDIIVGFPGETDEEFETSLAFAKEIGFYELHVFKYSKRKGTIAAGLPNQVPDPVKEDRSNRMLALRDELSAEYVKRHKGLAASVLFEEEKTVNGVKYLTGHTKEYIHAAIPLNEETAKLKNETVSVRLGDPISSEYVSCEPAK